MNDSEFQKKVFHATIISIGEVVGKTLRLSEMLSSEERKSVLAGLHNALCACLGGLHQFTNISQEEFGKLCGDCVTDFSRQNQRTRTEDPKDVVNALLADLKNKKEK